MSEEKILNHYYNLGRYNNHNRIGYVMDLIRKLKPLTIEEWEEWYINNIHDKEYIESLAIEMYLSIPTQHKISLVTCESYIYDVMFRRTFQGYNKEKQALKVLREYVSKDIKETPKEWDIKYFIDFYIPKNDNHPIIGIQLKPDTFFKGNYQKTVNIEEKMHNFIDDYQALVYILKYKQVTDKDKMIKFTNPKVIIKLTEQLKSN